MRHTGSMTLLQDAVEAAVRLPDVGETVAAIKGELSRAIREGRVRLEQRFFETQPDHYARRLLFANPELGYTAVVMTWGAGQRTAVHDHAGMWCVEGVVHGVMEVTQYDLEEQRDGLYRFRRAASARAEVGSAGSLIPPFEYHVLANPTQETSITLHIYGGEMAQCHVYRPREDGWYGREFRRLSYDE